jgi:hypothetical protein
VVKLSASDRNGARNFVRFLRQQADFIRHECGYRQALAMAAASQAESKIVDSRDDEFSSM